MDDIVKWSDSLSVGVEEIDEQHKKLIEYINRLHHATQAQPVDDLQVSMIIASLIDYAATHFTTEEYYFEEFAYPDKEEHQKIHASFVEKIQDVHRRFMSNERSVVGKDLLSYLKAWLIDHIQIQDKQYSELFQANGLK